MSECGKCGQYTGPGGPGCCCPTLSFGEPETRASDDEKRLAEIREHEATWGELGNPARLYKDRKFLLAKLDESERARKDLKACIESGQTAYNNERVARDWLAREKERLEAELAESERARKTLEEARRVVSPGDR